MTYTPSDLRLARWHARDGERRITALEQNISRAKARGQSTELAERALATMRVTLSLMLDHLNAIEQSLKR